MDYANKKTLITQNALHFMAGSEITTLELANFFKEHGADVLVFTWYLDEPMAKHFHERKINVITDENDPRLDKIDFAWIHHQVIPKRLLDNLTNKSCKTKFLFHHMSPILPLEWPYLGKIESQIATISLFNSQGTKDDIIKSFPSLKPKSNILENLLPQHFTTITHSINDLRKILMVSNHVPEELKEATKKLESSGIQVDNIGIAFKHELITPEILNSYDLVITIGKTVIYCLGINVPVYVYDHFGGPGFLNKTNFEKARYRTFSGRGFKSKTPEKIIEDINNNYQKAASYQTKNLQTFRNTFSIENQLSKILNPLPTAPISSYNISQEQLHTISAILHLVKDKIISEHSYVNLAKDYHLLQQKYTNLSLNYQKFKTENAAIPKAQQQTPVDTKQIKSSKKCRLFSKIRRIIHLNQK